MEKTKFNVLFWDINQDKLIPYDVLPYFRDCYAKKVKESKKKYVQKSEELSKYWKVPKTLKEFKDFVKNKSQYQFWSRCEYEMICHGWPVRKNDYKLDIHEQIMMNLDIIAEILKNENDKKKVSKTRKQSN